MTVCFATAQSSQVALSDVPRNNMADGRIMLS
jgi:hypothetical protein